MIGKILIGILVLIIIFILNKIGLFKFIFDTFILFNNDSKIGKRNKQRLNNFNKFRKSLAKKNDEI